MVLVHSPDITVSAPEMVDLGADFNSRVQSSMRALLVINIVRPCSFSHPGIHTLSQYTPWYLCLYAA